MSLPTTIGIYEPVLDHVVPVNTGTWADLSGSTWSSFRNWITEPADIVWPSGVNSLPYATYSNLQIDCDASNEVTFDVYTSSTGAFAGEETHVTIDPNDAAITAFYGKYYCVSVTVPAQSGQLNILNYIKYTVTTETFSISRSGVSTSTLSGSTSSRTISLDRSVSHIWSLDIQATGSSHTLEWYVTDYPTSTTLIPVVLTKSTAGPTFKLIGLDNVARDGTIDYEIVAMPEQRRDGNRLILV